MNRTELCRALDVSGGYLSRQFHAALGAPLQEQRVRLRVARFAALAVRGRRNWLDAALGAGFGSYSQLHRAFTRVVGVGPREYLCDSRSECSVGGGLVRKLQFIARRDQPEWSGNDSFAIRSRVGLCRAHWASRLQWGMGRTQWRRSGIAGALHAKCPARVRAARNRLVRVGRQHEPPALQSHVRRVG